MIIYLAGNHQSACENTHQAYTVLESLGFVVNDKKSSMIPTTRITHLGFVIDSVTMRVSLPEEKVLRIQHACSGMLKVQKVSTVLARLEPSLE